MDNTNYGDIPQWAPISDPYADAAEDRRRYKEKAIEQRLTVLETAIAAMMKRLMEEN